jgi:integrase
MWRKRTSGLFRDIVILMRDTGTRNQRELHRMRIENLDWENRVIFVPDSNTPEGRRLVPMSRRVLERLRARCGTRAEGWVFPSTRSAAGRLCSIDRLFREARQQAGLPKELVFYCGRHDYGTRVLMRTGNLAVVMRAMGRRDVKTAMHYQHPELEVVRAALDYDMPKMLVEHGRSEKGSRHFLSHTRRTLTTASHWQLWQMWTKTNSWPFNRPFTGQSSVAWRGELSVWR